MAHDGSMGQIWQQTSFYLPLLSDSSSELFDNTLSHFTVQLPEAIHLNGAYKVGLVELMVNPVLGYGARVDGIPTMKAQSGHRYPDENALANDLIAKLSRSLVREETESEHAVSGTQQPRYGEEEASPPPRPPPPAPPEGEGSAAASQPLQRVASENERLGSQGSTPAPTPPAAASSTSSSSGGQHAPLRHVLPATPDILGQAQPVSSPVDAEDVLVPPFPTTVDQPASLAPPSPPEPTRVAPEAVPASPPPPLSTPFEPSQPAGAEPTSGPLSRWVEYALKQQSSEENQNNLLSQFAAIKLPEYYQKFILPGEVESTLSIPKSSHTEDDWVVSFHCENGVENTIEWLREIASYTDSPDDALRLYDAWAGEWAAQLGAPRPHKRVRRAARSLTPAILNTKDNIETFQRMFIYCSIIEASIVSDTRARLLRIVHLEPSQSRYTFRTVYYSPLQYSTIQVIEIKMTDKFGVPMNFKSSVNPTTIYLHFIKA